jgi:hypothetical protein
MVLAIDNRMWCGSDQRALALRDSNNPQNGIDFVEYRRVGLQWILDVVFFKAIPNAPALTKDDFSVLGGVRVVGIKPIKVTTDVDPLRLHVYVDREGDFSSYILAIRAYPQAPHPQVDPERSQARFGFKAGCPTDLDCRPVVDCPPQTTDEPALDYLAKDYQSFRRLMVDLVALRNPGWQERLPSDLGITLVELFAYAGDYLSYFQDAGPGTESYLDTCLHRISAARHARLVDYRMHDGRNACSYVHFRAVAGTDGVVPMGTKLSTRIGKALIGAPSPPGTVLPSTADFEGDPALAGATVFETAMLTNVTAKHNVLRIHTWGDAQCCIAKGTTEAFLYGIAGPGGAETAYAPTLNAGDFLLLEEVRSPVTMLEADRDPSRRIVVRLTKAETAEDKVYTDAVPGGKLTPRSGAGDPVLPLQHVVWRDEDALPFTLCVSAVTTQNIAVDQVSVARGNVAAVDHGRTVKKNTAVDTDELKLPAPGALRWDLPSMILPTGPLTHQPMPSTPLYDSDGRMLLGRYDLSGDADQAMPAVVLMLQIESGPEEEAWMPVAHLLDSGPFDTQFVAEIDNDGRAKLRFGDDYYGRKPADVTRVRARYRVGNGRSGNIGAGALVHMVTPDPLDPLDPNDPNAPLHLAAVENVYQPLAAKLGADPQTIEEVRQLAPEAFRAIQFRAVTEQDWHDVAMRNPAIAAAKASFHWTGSWYTVFVAINPARVEDLVQLPGGGLALTDDFQQSITAYLTRFKLAGYDLQIRAATYVPLEIDITLCIAPGHFRGDVEDAVARVLSNQAYGDGTHGFFYLPEFDFGETIYLSRLYEAIERVEGLESATVTTFKRFWDVAGDELTSGVIRIGAFEIPRLDNDRNRPEDGVLRLTAVGGQ